MGALVGHTRLDLNQPRTLRQCKRHTSGPQAAITIYTSPIGALRCVTCLKTVKDNALLDKNHVFPGCLREVSGSQPKTTMVWLPASPAKRPNKGQDRPQSAPMRGKATVERPSMGQR